MIESMAFFALATPAATTPTMRRKEDNIVIVRKEQSASIEQAFVPLLAETVTTYQSDPPSANSDDVPFVSPVVSSVIVKAKVQIGGEIVQPPIDFGDVVYFDE